LRINGCFDRSVEDYLVSLSQSFMVSADNAHAVHPNYVEKADPVNRPRMNGGIVIKYNANQKYTTDAVSGAACRMICEKAEVPFQTFTNRSDVAGGSTLGNISGTQVALNTVDIGMAQLAMHSPYETAGTHDIEYLIKFSETFYASDIKIDTI
jgi:aspartyl aminopeptidase